MMPMSVLLQEPPMLEHQRRGLPYMLALLLLAAGASGFMLLAPAAEEEALATQQAPVIQGPMQDLELGNLSIRRFRFPAGSRLGWHTHLDGPQLLMMEDGKGRVQERGGPVVELRPNEPFVTLAGVEHWHGAAPDEGGVQWNIYDGIGVPGSVTWGSPVTDEEYNAPARTR
jgi:quercetin dioxygenase-like cupin family protein